MRSFDREKMRQDLILAHLGSDLSHHFCTMKEHFESVQALLAREANKIGSVTQQNIDAERVVLNDDSIWEEFDKHKNDFPDSQRNAFFIMAYAELEQTLIHVCATVLDLDLSNKKSEMDRPGKWFGNVLGKTKILFDELSISIVGHSSIWNEINQLRLLRNKIVHSGGWFSADSPLFAFLNAKSNLSLKDWNERHQFYKVQFTDEFIFTTFELFDTFLGVLSSCIHEWLRNKTG